LLGEPSFVQLNAKQTAFAHEISVACTQQSAPDATFFGSRLNTCALCFEKMTRKLLKY
jgi:hypothetical protein